MPCFISVCRGRGRLGRAGFCALVRGVSVALGSPLPSAGPPRRTWVLWTCFFLSWPVPVQTSSSREENQHVLDAVVCSSLCPSRVPSVGTKAGTRQRRDPRGTGTGARHRAAGSSRRRVAGPLSPPVAVEPPARGLRTPGCGPVPSRTARWSRSVTAGPAVPRQR